MRYNENKIIINNIICIRQVHPKLLMHILSKSGIDLYLKNSTPSSLYHTILLLLMARSGKCAYYILLILLLYDLGTRIRVVAGRYCTVMTPNPKGLTDTRNGSLRVRPSLSIELYNMMSVYYCMPCIYIYIQVQCLKTSTPLIFHAHII